MPFSSPTHTPLVGKQCQGLEHQVSVVTGFISLCPADYVCVLCLTRLPMALGASVTQHKVHEVHPAFLLETESVAASCPVLLADTGHTAISLEAQ